MNNNVYLVPLSNGTYVPYIEESAPCEEAVLLTREGKYPASLNLIVYDVYGGGDRFECTVQNRHELLKELFLCGQMCDAVFKLWDYDVNQDFSDNIGELFDLAYHTRMNAIRGDGNVNTTYAFVNTVSLDEYCAQCQKLIVR